MSLHDFKGKYSLVWFFGASIFAIQNDEFTEIIAAQKELVAVGA